MKLINNQSELESLLDDDGNAQIFGDTTITCDAVFPGNLNVFGTLKNQYGLQVRGCLIARGDLFVNNGDAQIDSNATVYGHASIHGNLTSVGELDMRGFVNVSEHLVCESPARLIDVLCKGFYSAGKVSIRGNIVASHIESGGDFICFNTVSCNGDFICEKSVYPHSEFKVIGDACKIGCLYWSHSTPPQIPLGSDIKSILPMEWQRADFERRFGVAFHGCYPHINKKVGDRAGELLKQDRWSEMERMIIESAAKQAEITK